jgi:hypothetical protein
VSELITVDNINPVDIFSGDELDDLLKRIEKEATSFTPDVSTNKGRKEIASMANKVARSKTTLDGLGKDLVSEWKQKAKVVDQERKKMRDYLDDLKAKVRQPLTEWEEAEEARTQKHEDNLREMVGGGEYSLANWMNLSAEAMRDRLKEIEDTKIDDSWDEFANTAAKAKDKAIADIKQAIEQREKYDAEQAELARLRAEQEERARQEAEERLRREGEERAKREAEEKAAAEAAKAEQERLSAIREKEAAEKRAAEAEANAKAQAEAAAQRERERIEQERIAEETAAKKREEDKKHRAKINNAARDAMVSAGINKDDATKIVMAIAKNQIPYVTIKY